VERTRVYWAIVGILGIVADSSHALELTPSRTQLADRQQESRTSTRPSLSDLLTKSPVVKDGDGRTLGSLVGLGYKPGSNQVDVFTDKGYILQIKSTGTLSNVAPPAYGGAIYRDASCELEEFVIKAVRDLQDPPPIVKSTQGVYEDSFGQPVYIRKDAVPRSLVYYAFQINEQTGQLECRLIDDDLTEFYSNWYGVGGPPPQVIDILPNDPSVTGFPGVAGESYPLKTPIKVEY